MADELYALTGEQVSRIKSMLDWYENGAPSHDRQRQRRPAPLDTRRRRLAKTCAESTGATYPTTGDTFWCKFVDGSFGDGWEEAEEGTNDPASFTAWAGGEKVLAHSRHAIYFPENTIVEIDQFNGQWWIDRYERFPLYTSTHRNSASTIAVSDSVGPFADLYRDPESEGQPAGVYAVSTGLYFTDAGSYLFGFSGALYSDAAIRNEQLLLRVYINSSSTSYFVEHKQDIEQLDGGSDAMRDRAQFAIGGPIQVPAGATLRVQNDSASTVIVVPAYFWAMSLQLHDV